MEGAYYKPFSSYLLIIPILLLPFPCSTQSFKVLAVEYDWILRLEKLRAETLDRLFPQGADIILRAINPFGIGFVDYRDPLELISYITLYLPGALFILNVLFFMIPHVLKFLLFTPKLWFFGLPCLYSFHKSPLKRKRRRRRKRDTAFNEVIDEPIGPCGAVNLAHITELVFKGLVKFMEQQPA